MACKRSLEQRLVHIPSPTLPISGICQWGRIVPGKDYTSYWKKPSFSAEQKDNHSIVPYQQSAFREINSPWNDLTIEPYAPVYFENIYQLICWTALQEDTMKEAAVCHVKSLMQISCMATWWDLLLQLSLFVKARFLLTPHILSFCTSKAEAYGLATYPLVLRWDNIREITPNTS